MCWKDQGVSGAYGYIFSNVPGHTVMEVGQVIGQVSEVKSSE